MEIAKPNRNLINVYHLFGRFYIYRTKWKRQTAVGLELLAEAGKFHCVTVYDFIYRWI